MSNLSEDKKKFSDWWKGVEKMVILVAQRYVGTRAAAEDIAQDVAIASYKNIRNFADKDHFKGWIMTRTRWLSIDALRRNKVESKRMFDVKEMIAPSKQRDPLITRELYDAIKLLPKTQREVVLGILNSKTSEELAKDLGIEAPTVRSHKRHAIRRLTTLLD